MPKIRKRTNPDALMMATTKALINILSNLAEQPNQAQVREIQEHLVRTFALLQRAHAEVRVGYEQAKARLEQVVNDFQRLQEENEHLRTENVRLRAKRT